MQSRRPHLALAYRLLLVFVLTFSALWPLAGPPASLRAAPPGEPPSPTPVATSTPQPPGPDISSQRVTPPSPEDLPPEAEQARAQQAMQAALEKYLDYWGPRYQAAPIQVDVEGEWAHGVAAWQSEARPLSGPIHILARRLPDGEWQALLPGNDKLYFQWVDEISESLVPAGVKSELRSLATDAGASLSPEATPRMLQVVPSTVPIQVTNTPKENDFESAILQGIQSGRWELPSDTSPDVQWVNTDYSWAVAFVYFIDLNTGIPLQTAPGIIPGQRMEGKWIISFPDEVDYGSAISHLPRTLLPASFLVPVGIPKEDISIQEARNVGKLPWACDKWRYVSQDRQNSGGSHYPGGSDEWAWDFGLSTDEAIHASRAGVVAHIFTGTPKDTGCLTCDWTKANRIVIDHEDGTASLYMHLSNKTPPVLENQRVSAGDVIGYADHTGKSGGTHLHFALQPWNSDWNGKVTGILWYQHSIESLFDDPNVEGGNPTYPNSYKSGNCGTSCPRSGGVILYWNKDYTCDNGDGDPGYRQRTSTGFENISGAFNDKASSVRVPSGWSVRLYEHADGGGSSACRSGNDNDFAGDNFDDSSVPLNDYVSSFEVFDNIGCSSGPPPGSWKVDYYNGKDFNSYASTDFEASSFISHDWGTNSPGHSVGNDNFSIRYERTAYFGESGDWKFSIRSDDGFRLYVDGQLLAQEWWDGWHDVGPTRYLAAGDHQVKLEYFEGAGDARVELSWARYEAPTPTPTQPSAGAWKVDYYNSKDLNSLASTDYETSSFISHDWGTNSPGHGVGTDNFSIRYERTAYFNESGDWKFTVRSDDGFRLYVDGQLLAQEWWDGWHDIGPTKYLSAGNHKIKLEYFEGGGNAKVELSWARHQAPTSTPTPTRTSTPTPTPTTDPNGYWSLRFWNNTDFSGNPVWNGTASPGDFINIDWGTDSPGSGVNADNFADRWEQTVYFPSSGTWKFTIRSDDGFRIYIDDQLLAHEWWVAWHDVAPSRYLSAGNHQIRVEHFDAGGPAKLQLYWNREEPPTPTPTHTPTRTPTATPTNTPLPTATPYTCNDVHEPNNSSGQATSISFGQTRRGIICPGGDYDYYKFIGTAGQKVVVDIDARSIDSSLDSYIYLVDSDGSTILRWNDDEPTSYDSKLGHQLPHNGTYYIKVRDYNDVSAGGSDYFYDIKVFVDDLAPSARIISPAHYAWLHPTLQIITTDVSDSQSGIRHVTFYWHDADWDNSDWIVLDDDWDPSDGWNYDWDTSTIPEQQGGAVYIYAYDWAGNSAGWGSYGIGLDRTPPTVTTEVEPMYGDAPFLDFWVNWWNSWDNLSGIASYDVQYRDGLAGTWTNLLTNTSDDHYRFVGQNGRTYYFRARARDYAGNLSTYAGGNGDTQYMVQVCAISADAREPDNSYAAAKRITTNGTRQSHNFHAAGDQDWLKFTATAGVTYTLATANTGGHADTMLSLYDTNGTTLLAFNDDDPDNWPASRLAWGARRDGTYYVKVEHWDPHAYGCTTAYDVSIAETGAFEVSQNVFLPLILK